jgi:hypothetical protein
MNEAAKAQAEAIFKRRQLERAEFEAQLQAQRDKAQRLRALRLAREESPSFRDQHDLVRQLSMAKAPS